MTMLAQRAQLAVNGRFKQDYRHVVLQMSGVLSYFRCHEASGALTCEKAAGDGTASDAPTSYQTAGPLLRGKTYGIGNTGVNDRIATGWGGLVSNTFSWSWWAKPQGTIELIGESTNNNEVSAWSPEQQMFGATSSGSVGVQMGTNGVAVYEHGGGHYPARLVYAITLSGWNHFVVRISSKAPSLYINGVFRESKVASPLATLYPPVFIGSSGAYNDAGAGEVSEVVLFDHVLSQAEIDLLYNTGIQ